MVWYGLAWSDLVWLSMVALSLVRLTFLPILVKIRLGGPEIECLVWFGMVWFGLVRIGLAWYGCAKLGQIDIPVNPVHYRILMLRDRRLGLIRVGFG